MKKTFRFVPLLIVALATIAMSSCGGDPLEKAVKNAFLNGDTTETTYNDICTILNSNPERYCDYVDKNGNINVQNLAQYINKIGQSLRPPMTWHIARYGAKNLTLTVYFERSGSMVPYDSQSGGGQLKKAVNDLINFFPSKEGTSISIVNDNIYPYNGSIDSFLQDRNIYETTKGTGNATYTDFKLIFDKIFKAQKPDNVSVLVTDMIYSPKNTQGVSIEKIMNEENSLATSIFKNYKGKSIIVNQLMGDFDGMYYPYNGKPFHYKGQRPFYIIVIADAGVIDRMANDNSFKNFLNPTSTLNSYRFNQAESQPKYTILPEWKNNAGQFRENRNEQGTLTHCEGDRQTGILAFSIAVKMDALQKGDDFLTNTGNYNVQSQNGFTLKVEKINAGDINGNNKEYLEGKTHVITLTGKLKSPKDEITLSLRNDFPQWIVASTSNDDTATGNNFSKTTFGLERFLRGIYDAFSVGENNYSIIRIKIKK